MPISAFNGVQLYYEDTGSGEALVLVHGSWTDHRSWSLVAPPLAERYRVVAYDRRGHSRSERPDGQGSVREDVRDLAALIEEKGLAPAHVVANSFGGSIALRLAAERPELLRSLAVHEPPLFGLLEADPALAPVLDSINETMARAVVARLEAGDMEGGARRFVDAVIGPGAWEVGLTPEDRQTFITNAPTFLDEARDPDALTLDTVPLASFSRPTLLTVGSASPPLFPPVVARLGEAITSARRHGFEGAGHVPHMTHPREFVDVVTSLLQSSA